MQNETDQFPVSSALRKARLLRRLSQAEAADLVGLNASELRLIEVGCVSPDSETVVALVEAYGLDAARLGTDEWVPRSDPRLDVVAHILWLEWMPISYGDGTLSNAEVLSRVSEGIRFLRSLDPLAPLHMRTHEMDLLLQVLDLEDPGLAKDITTAFRIPWRETERMLHDLSDRIRCAKISDRAQQIFELAATHQDLISGDAKA